MKRLKFASSYRTDTSCGDKIGTGLDQWTLKYLRKSSNKKYRI